MINETPRFSMKQNLLFVIHFYAIQGITGILYNISIKPDTLPLSYHIIYLFGYIFLLALSLLMHKRNYYADKKLIITFIGICSTTFVFAEIVILFYTLKENTQIPLLIFFTIIRIILYLNISINAFLRRSLYGRPLYFSSLLFLLNEAYPLFSSLPIGKAWSHSSFRYRVRLFIQPVMAISLLIAMWILINLLIEGKWNKKIKLIKLITYSLIFYSVSTFIFDVLITYSYLPFLHIYPLIMKVSMLSSIVFDISLIYLAFTSYSLSIKRLDYGIMSPYNKRPQSDNEVARKF